MINIVPKVPDGIFQLPKPKVFLGGEPLELTGFTWEIPVGVEPGLARFIVDRRRWDKFWPPGGEDGAEIEDVFHGGDVGNTPVTLRFEIPEIVRGTTRTFRETWESVYIMERRFIDRENAAIVAADHRVYWQQAVTGSFNIPQRINDFTILENGGELDIPGQVDQKARFGVVRFRAGRGTPEGTLDNFVGKQIRQPVLRYRPWSLKRPLFGVPGLAPEDQERPWPALDIAIALLVGRESYAYRISNNVGNPRWTWRPGILKDTSKLRVVGDPEYYSDYAPDKVVWECKPVKDALAEMLELARAGIYVGRDGVVTIFPIDDDDPNTGGRIPGGVRAANVSGAWFEAGSAFLEKLDNRAYRPSAVRCAFSRLHEIDLRVTSALFTSPDEQMQNVTPAPAERFISLLNKTVAAGELVPTQILLRSYQVNDELVITYWNLRSELAARIKEANGLSRTLPDQEIDTLVINLQESYRQLFKLRDEWVEVLKSLQSSLVTVIDSNGRQSPGLVFCKYPVINGFRAAREFLEEEGSSVAGYNIDASSVTGDSAPYFVTIEDEELGLLRVSPVSDQQNGDVFLNIPSGFKQEKVDQLYAHLNASGADWGNVPLEENWSLTLRISAEFFEPNDESRFLMIEVPAQAIESDVTALGPPREVKFDREPARFDWREQLVNSEMLKAIAAAEARRIMYSFRDRWVATGPLKFAGGYRVVPWGSVASVAWEYTAEAALSTQIRFNESTTPPRIEQELQRKMLYFLERRPPTQ